MKELLLVLNKVSVNIVWLTNWKTWPSPREKLKQNKLIIAVTSMKTKSNKILCFHIMFQIKFLCNTAKKNSAPWKNVNAEHA